MKEYIYLISYKIFKLIARNMPDFVLDALASFIYMVDKKHRKIVKINLDIAFVNMSDKEKEKISKTAPKIKTPCYKKQGVFITVNAMVRNTNVMLLTH